MQRFVCRTAVVLSLTAATTSAALAQGGAATTATAACDPAGTSSTIAKATFSLSRAFDDLKDTTNTAKATKDLQGVVATLTADPAAKKEPASAFLLGKAYVLLLMQPGIAPISTHAAVGITADPTATIDLFAAADSAFTAVTTANPECAATIAQWRQQKPWLNTINGAITALNANKLDSAEVLAKRSLELARDVPYAYTVLSDVARSRKDYAAATQYLKQAIQVAGTDSAYTDVREKAMYGLGTVTTARAAAATGADKKALTQEAIAAWKAYLASAPPTQDAQIADAQQNMAKLSAAMGDSSAAAGAYAPLLANPAKYGESALLNAGIVATTTKHPADAAKLFAAVLDANPYQHDGLNNLAATYIGLGEYAKVFPLVDRLVQIDPNNPDAWLLYAYTYSGMLKDTKDAKLKKAYSDSLVKYSSISDEMPVKVAVTEFSHGGAESTVAGTIENRSKTLKTYALTVEFLDKTGAVIATQSTSVGPVAPKAAQPFKVTTPNGAPVAFRYKPLK